MAINTWGEALNTWNGGVVVVNNPPSVTITASAITVNAGETFTLTANVTDADIADTHTYLWSSGQTTRTITLTAPSLIDASTITRTCVVNDGTVDSNIATVTVNVNAFIVDPTPDFSGDAGSINTYYGLTVKNGVDYIYNNSDVRFVKIPYIDNVVVAATALQLVDYFIIDRHFNIVLHKTLGNGVSLDVNGINIHIDDADTLKAGTYYHQIQFTVFGDKLQPAMLRKLKVLNAFKLSDPV